MMLLHISVEMYANHSFRTNLHHFVHLALACAPPLEFDGEDDYVSLNHRALDGLEDCTVECLVYIEQDDSIPATISAAA